MTTSNVSACSIWALKIVQPAKLMAKTTFFFFYLIIMNNVMHQKVHIVFPKLLLSRKLYEAGDRDDPRPWKAWKHWLCAYEWCWNQETLIAPAGQGVLLALASDFQHWHEILDCLEVLTTRMTSDPGGTVWSSRSRKLQPTLGWLVTSDFFLSFPVRECRKEATKECTSD